MSFIRHVIILLVGVLGGVGSSVAQNGEPLNLKSPIPQTLPQPEVTVGENIQVSTANRTQPHFELTMAAHPSKPGVLLGSGMIWTGAAEGYNAVVYRSVDGGQSWTQTLTVNRPGMTWDPTLAIGPNGWAYFAAFSGGWMGLYRSSDGGTHWTDQELESYDRPWLSVSPAGSKTEGRLYLHGSGEPEESEGDTADVTLFRADEHGTRFRSTAGLDLAREDREVLLTGDSVVLADGTVVFPYLVRLSDISVYESKTLAPPRERRRPNALLKVAVSTDGDSSFASEPIARWYHRFGRGRTATVPSLTVDTTSGPFSGRVYVAWTDFRTGDGQVLLSHSDRPTEDWSDPITVNRSGGPAFRPQLAINENGILGISWYDRRDSRSQLGWRTRFAASRDGGTTVGQSVPAAESPYRYSWDGGLVVRGETDRGNDHTASSFLHGFNESGGDTAGLVADGHGTFHPLWVDNRTGVPQMWTAPVEVSGEALRHGSRALSTLDEVTRRTALRVRDSRYNDSTQIATLEMSLQNVSPDTLHGPMALRFIDLWSEFGEVQLPDGRRPHGTVQPVTPHLSGGTLPPDSSTTAFTVRARIQDPEPLGPMPPPPPGREVPGYAVLQIRAQVLGNVAGTDG